LNWKIGISYFQPQIIDGKDAESVDSLDDVLNSVYQKAIKEFNHLIPRTKRARSIPRNLNVKLQASGSQINQTQYGSQERKVTMS
jgi:hypothetical protein